LLHVEDEAETLARYAIALVLASKTDTKAWRSQAREAQLPPDEFTDWYVRGGRGSGKTWAASHTLAEYIDRYPGQDWAVIAPTYGDGRDTCVEGDSGLLRALGPDRVRAWNRSMGEIQLSAGGSVFVDGADDGALRVQGKNLAGVWADEVGLWKPTQWRKAWEESIGFAVRIFPSIRIATGTPKRGHPLPRLLMTSPGVAQTLLLTEDNVANLDPGTVERWKAQYEGTVLGRQELYGELLDDADGALWSRGLIRYRPRIEMQRIVVAIDPAVTGTADSDETGIIVAGKGIDGQGYILEDRSGIMTPLAWARQAVDAYAVWGADLIVAESNNGGEMVRVTLNSVDSRVPVSLVHASKGKFARAEPVQMLYEKDRVFHTEPMPELEDQMCNWSPKDGTRSPDRIDALVWALTDLMLDDPWGGYTGSSIA
jgi:phage terminase large subunit-like protein